MIHPASHSPRSGFTLAELLVAFWLLAGVAMMMMATLWAAVRIQTTDAAAFHKLLQFSDLADQFRGDVTRAVSAPEQWGILRADEATLFLDFPDGSHAIYYVGDQSLERIDLDAAYEPTTIKGVYTLETKQIAFARNENGSLLTLRLTDIEPRVDHRHHVEIMAALGGDLR